MFDETIFNENLFTLDEASYSARALDLNSAEGKKKLLESIKATVEKKKGKLKEGEYFATSVSQLPKDKIKGFLDIKYKKSSTDMKKLISIGGYAALCVSCGLSTDERAAEVYIFILNKNKPNKVKAIKVHASLFLRI